MGKNKEYLLKLGVCKDNEYLDKYIDLVNKYKDSPYVKGVSSSHHIVPVHYFKYNKLEIDNSSFNRVNLSYSNHLLAHYYLYKCASNTYYEISNLTPLALLSSEIDEEWIIRHSVDLDEAFKREAEIKKEIRLGQKYINKDNINKVVNVDDIDAYLQEGWSLGRVELTKRVPWNKGKTCTEEQRNVFSKAHIGQRKIYKDSIELCVNQEELTSYLNDGWVLGRPESVKNNISKGSIGTRVGFKGKTQSKQARNSISKANKDNIYIYKDNIVKHVTKENLYTYLNEGWLLGNPKVRERGKFAWVCNEIEVKHIPINELEIYLDKGYMRGRKYK